MIITLNMRKDGWVLNQLLDELPFDAINMVEIGCGYGESTGIFLAHPKVVKLTSIDPFLPYSELPYTDIEEMYGSFREVIAKYPEKSVFIRAASQDAAGMIQDGSLDFVYIDGAHDQKSCERDIQMYTPKLKDTGVLGGHDFLFNEETEGFPWRYGPRLAVKAMFGEPDKVYGDSSWIVRAPHQKIKKVVQP